MKSKKIIIGSRGSKLALIYAEIAKNKILEFCTKVEIKKITTTGAIDQKNTLSDIGGKGLFSKQIENDLLNKKIDIAVHALKDMPSEETKGSFISTLYGFPKKYPTTLLGLSISPSVPDVISVTSAITSSPDFNKSNLIVITI